MKRLLFLMLFMIPVAASSTVVTQTYSVSFTCSGSAGPYPFSFPISDPTAMTVTQAGTVLSPTAYTVIPLNNIYDNGGSVTLNTACSSGTLLLERNTPVTQTSVYTDNMPIPMKSFENSLDKLTEIIQDRPYVSSINGNSGSFTLSGAVACTGNNPTTCTFTGAGAVGPPGAVQFIDSSTDTLNGTGNFTADDSGNITANDANLNNAIVAGYATIEDLVLPGVPAAAGQNCLTVDGTTHIVSSTLSPCSTGGGGSYPGVYTDGLTPPGLMTTGGIAAGSVNGTYALTGFGADPTGATNSATAINTAFASGHPLDCEGTFSINSELVANGDLVLTSNNGCTITANATMAALISIGATAGTVQNKGLIRGVQLNGNAKCTNVLAIGGLGTVFGMKIVSSQIYGAIAQNILTGNNVWELNLDNTKVYSAGTHGVEIGSASVAGEAISFTNGTDIYANGGNGLMIDQSGSGMSIFCSDSSLDYNTGWQVQNGTSNVGGLQQFTSSGCHIESVAKWFLNYGSMALNGTVGDNGSSSGTLGYLISNLGSTLSIDGGTYLNGGSGSIINPASTGTTTVMNATGIPNSSALAFIVNPYGTYVNNVLNLGGSYNLQLPGSLLGITGQPVTVIPGAGASYSFAAKNAANTINTFTVDNSGDVVFVGTGSFAGTVTTPGLVLSTLTSQPCLGTNSGGTVIAGTCSGGGGTVTDGAGTTTTPEFAESTSTAHVIQYKTPTQALADIGAAAAPLSGLSPTSCATTLNSGSINYINVSSPCTETLPAIAAGTAYLIGANGTAAVTVAPPSGTIETLNTSTGGYTASASCNVPALGGAVKVDIDGTNSSWRCTWATAAQIAQAGTITNSTTGTAGNLSGTPALPNGTSATTQAGMDNSTKLATTAYTDSAVGVETAARVAAEATKVATTTTVNGHALSSNVVVSASDLSTGTLPHPQLPALVSGDMPNPGPSSKGGVESLDCLATFGAGYGLQKINTDGSVSCAQFVTSGSGATLTAVAGALTSDITITTGGTWYDGPSVSLTAGTWHLTSTMTLLPPGGARTLYCKLWDGASVLTSTQSWQNASTGQTLSLSGSVTLASSDTYKTSCTDNAGSTLMKAAMTSNGAGNNASTLVAVAVSGGTGGGGSGSGTVNTGYAGQVAVYSSNGSVVSGANAISQSNMPPLFNSGTGETSSTATLTSVYDPTLSFNPISQYTNKVSLRPNTSTYTYDQTTTSPTSASPAGALTDTNAFPGSGTLVINWNTSGTGGFTTGGILEKVRFYPSAITNSGTTINVWALHPTASLPSGTGVQSITMTVIAPVCTIVGDAANVYQECAGLNIPVSVGDVLGYSAVGRGIPSMSASTLYNTWQAITPGLGGWSSTAGSSFTALSALTAGESVTFSSTSGMNLATREYLISADIIPGAAFSTSNQAGSVLRLDSNGNIPAQLGRAADMPWQGKKIIWVGTSIPAQTSGTPATTYPQIVAAGLQANLDNESVGSSGIVWNGTRCLSLMATPAQLTAATGCSGYTAQSYQNKVMGKSADLLVIDHGHNDTAINATLGTISDIATGTAYSASSGTLTITAANNFTNGETVLMIAGSTDALLPLNGQTFTVLSGGLSSTQYEITTGAVTGSGTTKAVAANTSTFYGAEQALIAAAYTDNPSIRIVLVTPPKNIDRGYSPALDMTASGIRPAIFAIAALWQLPVVDLAANDGFNDTNYCVGGALPCTIYTPDGTHPAPFARAILARILYQALKGL